MNEFCENNCINCEHGKKWIEDCSFSHHFGIERSYEDRITCTLGKENDDPSGAWDCPLMVAAHEVNVAKGETDCPITCEYISYEIKDELPEGEAIQYCHRRKGECAQKLKKGA